MLCAYIYWWYAGRKVDDHPVYLEALKHHTTSDNKCLYSALHKMAKEGCREEEGYTLVFVRMNDMCHPS